VGVSISPLNHGLETSVRDTPLSKILCIGWRTEVVEKAGGGTVRSGLWETVRGSPTH